MVFRRKKKRVPLSFDKLLQAVREGEDFVLGRLTFHPEEFKEAFEKANPGGSFYEGLQELIGEMIKALTSERVLADEAKKGELSELDEYLDDSYWNRLPKALEKLLSLEEEWVGGKELVSAEHGNQIMKIIDNEKLGPRIRLSAKRCRDGIINHYRLGHSRPVP